MDENRNTPMNGMGGAPMPGMNPNMGGPMPNMGGMAPNMGAAPMPGMAPNMGGAQMPGMGAPNAPGGMNRPPMGPNGMPNQRANGASTSIVSVNGQKPNAANDKKKKEKKPGVAASVFAVLFFLLMAGGVFIGMLGQFWAPLSPSSLYIPEGVEASNILPGSLINVAITLVLHINAYLDFSGGFAGIVSSLQNLLPAISILILAVSIVYSLVAAIIAFSRANGQRALAIISSCMIVGYGSCGFFTYVFGEVDLGCLALAAIGLITSLVTAMAMQKQIGVFNVVISVLSIGATAIFALPDSPLRVYAFDFDASNLMRTIVGLAALGILYLNFLFTSARICAKKGKIFDLILHILQFAVIVTVFVMAILSKDPVFNLFAMFMPLLCSVGAPALALITVVFAIVIIFMPKILEKQAAKKAAKAGKEGAVQEQPAEEAQNAAQPQLPAPAGAMAPNGMQQPMQQPPQQMRPPMAPQQQPMPQQPMPQQQPMAQQPPMWQQPPMPPQGRPRYKNMDDEFSRATTSFKVPFSTGGTKTVVETVVEKDPAAQAEIDRLNAELRAMREAQNNKTDSNSKEDSETKAAIESLSAQLRAMQEAQNNKTSIEINSKEDAATKAALESLTAQLRAMQNAQAQAANPNDPAILAAIAQLSADIRSIKQGDSRTTFEINSQEDPATRAAIDGLSAQLRAMQDAQAHSANPNDPATVSAIAQLTAEIRAMKEAEAERIKAMEARLEAQRKEQDDARIADAERIAAQARAEAERIAKEAEAKAEQARLEAAKQTEEERKKLEEERRKLEEERKAAEEARIAAERRAQEAREEAERRAEEARREAERKEAERKAQEAREEAERIAREAAETKAAAERHAAEARAEAERHAAETKAEAERQAAAARAEAERKSEEERKRFEEEKRQLEEERRKMEQQRIEDERRRKEEMEQFKREMLEMKNAQAAQPAPVDNSKDENMARIMEELRALKEAQANLGNSTSTTTYNYVQDDSNKEELSEFEKRMEELIRSQQKKEEPKPQRELTAFEKRMAELAARKAAAAAAGETTPKPAPKTVEKPAEPEAQELLRYNCDAPDKFLATLTNKEINEFCDVFVADKLGVLSYMPGYKIGGDNKTFFNKVFIYLGKFRSQVSQSLLDKLFKYMRSPH